MPVDRVGHRDAVIAVPTGDGVEEGFFVSVAELQFPRLTAISGLVDARVVTVADAENVSGVGVEGFDVAEVEFLGRGDGIDVPRLAAVDGPDHGAGGAAGPDDVVIYDGEAAKAGGRLYVLLDPLCEGRGCHGAKEYCGEKESRGRHRSDSKLILLSLKLGRAESERNELRTQVFAVVGLAARCPLGRGGRNRCGGRGRTGLFAGCSQLFERRAGLGGDASGEEDHG